MDSIIVGLTQLGQIFFKSGMATRLGACPLRIYKGSRDQPSRPAHSFVEFFPLLLIQEEQIVSYWQKNAHLVQFNLNISTLTITWISI